MRQQETRVGETRATGTYDGQFESTTVPNNPLTTSSLDLSTQMMCRTIHRFALEMADTTTTTELIELRDASAAALARLIGAGDAKPYEIAYAAAHVDALDAAVAERAWQTFARSERPAVTMRRVRRIAPKGGQHAA